MSEVLIKGGRVIDPESGFDETAKQTYLSFDFQVACPRLISPYLSPMSVLPVLLANLICGQLSTCLVHHRPCDLLGMVTGRYVDKWLF